MLEIKELTAEDLQTIEDGLSGFDDAHMRTRLSGSVKIGVYDNDVLVGGADACITTHRILYVSTVFVDARCRRRGIGRLLMQEIERRAKEIGASLIRLDTFDWQGKDFYLALGYEIVGQYEAPDDGFAEYFFLKRI